MLAPTGSEPASTVTVPAGPEGPTSRGRLAAEDPSCGPGGTVGPREGSLTWPFGHVDLRIDSLGCPLLEPVPLKEPIPQEGIGGHRMLGLLVGLGLEGDQATVRSAKRQPR
jgi:hypothetical protein